METPSGIANLRSNFSEVVCISREFRDFETVISTICWRLSARSRPKFRKLTMPLVAAFRRSVSMPEVRAGKLILTITEINATTTSSSIMVTPRVLRWCPRCARLILPADDIGIQPIPAGRAVGAVAQHVGIVTVLAGKLVDVGMAPGVRSE